MNSNYLISKKFNIKVSDVICALVPKDDEFWLYLWIKEYREEKHDEYLDDFYPFLEKILGEDLFDKIYAIRFKSLDNSNTKMEKTPTTKGMGKERPKLKVDHFNLIKLPEKLRNFCK